MSYVNLLSLNTLTLLFSWSTFTLCSMTKWRASWLAVHRDWKEKEEFLLELRNSPLKSLMSTMNSQNYTVIFLNTETNYIKENLRVVNHLNDGLSNQLFQFRFRQLFKSAARRETWADLEDQITFTEIAEEFTRESNGETVIVSVDLFGGYQCLSSGIDVIDVVGQGRFQAFHGNSTQTAEDVLESTK